MQIGRSRLATGKICAAQLLGMGPIVLVMPGSDVAFSQGSIGA